MFTQMTALYCLHQLKLVLSHPDAKRSICHEQRIEVHARDMCHKCKCSAAMCIQFLHQVAYNKFLPKKTRQRSSLAALHQQNSKFYHSQLEITYLNSIHTSTALPVYHLQRSIFRTTASHNQLTNYANLYFSIGLTF